MMRLTTIVAAAAMALSLAACQRPDQVAPDVLSAKPAVELRAMQTRAYDTTDRNKTLRAIVATLQDMGYTLDKVEPLAGTVSATKLSTLRLTATVYPRGASQMTVRANAMVKIEARNTQVDDPQFYQKLFFEPLSKAMFLQALQVEDSGGGQSVAPNKAVSGSIPASEPVSKPTPAQGN